MNLETFNNIKSIINKTKDNVVVEKLELDGFSGNKLLYLIHELTNHLCSNNNIYLEIGVFRGLTLLTNSKKNLNVKCYGIDNFSLFDSNLENKNFLLSKIKELNLNNCNLIDLDYENALDNLKKYINHSKIGVYFIDGAHDYRSQLVSLLRIKPFLDENSVIIIDDANYPHVRHATNDFLKSHSEFALLFEAYTKSHPFNMSKDDYINIAKNGWWNGVNVIINDSNNYLPKVLTEESNKELYFITHDIFRNKFAKISYDIIKLAQESKYDELSKLIDNNSKLDLFNHQNTFSEYLPSFNLIE
jgi:hypothetical protein